MDQAGGRVHVQGRAHHGEDVRPRHPPGRLRDHRDRLPEPDDMGAQRGAVRIRLSELHPAVADVADPGLVPDAAHLGQLPVQVQHLRASGALVQVVHVVRSVTRATSASASAISSTASKLKQNLRAALI